ncbi:MAG: hypothetical protein ACE5GE_14295 [Phycisphaerae bacterium]
MPSTASTIHLDSADGPVPVRYGWLKRILIGSGCLLVGLVLLRLWWGYEANRRLQAQIDRYRAAGQPVFVEDFIVEVPDVENAVIPLGEALEAMQVSTGTMSLGQPAWRNAPDELDRLIEINSVALEKLREVRKRPGFSWDPSIVANSLSGGPPPPMRGYRDAAKLLRLSARYHHRCGNDAEFVEGIFDLLALGEVVDHHPTNIATLVAHTIYGLAYELVERFGARIRIASGPANDGAHSQAVSSAQVLSLINRLIDDENRYREGVVLGLCAGRASSLGALPTGTWLKLVGVRDILITVVQPTLALDAIRLARWSTAAASAAIEPNWRAAQSQLPNLAEPQTLLRQATHVFGGMVDTTTPFPYWHFIEFHFKFMAKRRLAATALAIRLFEVDHGHRPGRLAELVPDYLSSVPQDPFEPDGGPIRYRPGGDDPMLYSVGVNGLDEGGVFARKPDGQVDWSKNRRDILFHLNGRPVVPPQGLPTGTIPAPSPQAGDDDHDHEDASRDQDQRDSGDE